MQQKLLDELHLFGVPGSNLAEVMVFPQIDHTSTTSNDVVEMGL
eukprot:gene30597-40668_t